MAALFGLATFILVVWLAARALRPRPAARQPAEQPQVDLLIDALYRDGVSWGYQRAWQQQVEAERQRVAAFVRRRDRVTLSTLLGAATLEGLVLTGALGALPRQAAWGSNVGPWPWAAAAAVVAVGAWWLGTRLVPRNYAKFQASPMSAAKVASLDGEFDDALRARTLRQVDIAKAHLGGVLEERYVAGLEQGKRQALGQGLRSEQEAQLQARVSSAANAAYVQGRRDGVVEGVADTERQVQEGYRRGVLAGERAAMAGLEARLRTERGAGYQAGFEAGQRAAATGTQASARPAGAERVPRPRTRSEALAVLELAEGAALTDIEARYRELRAAVHPDAFRAKKLPRALVMFAEEQFKLVGEAYDILKR